MISNNNCYNCYQYNIYYHITQWRIQGENLAVAIPTSLAIEYGRWTPPTKK